MRRSKQVADVVYQGHTRHGLWKVHLTVARLSADLEQPRCRSTRRSGWARSQSMLKGN
jgi:hypothetical protein